VFDLKPSRVSIVLSRVKISPKNLLATIALENQMGNQQIQGNEEVIQYYQQRGVKTSHSSEFYKNILHSIFWIRVLTLIRG
jgi:hypothetical protein